LRSHRLAGVIATEVPGAARHIYAATYGRPSDSPAATALLAALAAAALTERGVSTLSRADGREI
jgi:hypothetical protein